MGVQLWGRAVGGSCGGEMSGSCGPERVGHLAPGYAVLPNLRLQPSNVKLDYDPVCSVCLLNTMSCHVVVVCVSRILVYIFHTSHVLLYFPNNHILSLRVVSIT